MDILVFFLQTFLNICKLITFLTIFPGNCAFFPTLFWCCWYCFCNIGKERGQIILFCIVFSINKLFLNSVTRHPILMGFVSNSNIRHVTHFPSSCHTLFLNQSTFRHWKYGRLFWKCFRMFHMSQTYNLYRPGGPLEWPFHWLHSFPGPVAQGPCLISSSHHADCSTRKGDVKKIEN